MKGDIDLREIQWGKLRLTRQRWTLLLVAVGVVAVLALSWRYVTHPPKPWLVRWKLDRYLKKESHASHFRVDFAFPSKATHRR